MNGAAVRHRNLISALAALAWGGVLSQGILTLHAAAVGGHSLAAGLAVFFSYFTVLTNTLVCVALTAASMAPHTAAGRFFTRSDVVAGVATSILFVGLSYHFLLRNTWNPQGLQLLCDLWLHYVMPLLFLVYWWFVASKSGLRWGQPFIWGLYPVVYLGYALMLGASTGRYPYGFIDAATIGYPRTFLNGIGLLVVFILLGLLLVTCGRLQRQEIALQMPVR